MTGGGGGSDRSPVAVKFKVPSLADTLSHRSAVRGADGSSRTEPSKGTWVGGGGGEI